MNSFLIDKITNSIEEVISGKSCSTIVHSATSIDIRGIHKKDGWRFNWKNEYRIQERLIFKLTLEDDGKIQGLISIEPMKSDQFIEMHLIENAPHNFGSKKHYYGVAANLVAFACKMSFEMGFDGFVAFNAKTRLIEHYKATLFAQQISGSGRMVIVPEFARFLVNSYYKSHFNE